MKYKMWKRISRWAIYLNQSDVSSKCPSLGAKNIVNLKSNIMKNTFWAHFTVGNIYENLDKGVYEYTNAILDMSLNELDKGCRFP